MELTKQIALFTALSEVQGELKNPKQTAENPFYKSKYSPLNTVLDTVKPVLKKYGLAIAQIVSGDETRVAVTTWLTHKDGGVLKSRISCKPDKETPQGMGIVIAYLRRYSEGAILNIASEEDTDGNQPGEAHKKKTAPAKTAAKKKPTPAAQKKSDDKKTEAHKAFGASHAEQAENAEKAKPDKPALSEGDFKQASYMQMLIDNINEEIEKAKELGIDIKAIAESVKKGTSSALEMNENERTAFCKGLVEAICDHHKADKDGLLK